MMTKQEERKRLRESLPSRYSKLAIIRLKGLGFYYSKRTVLAVAAGDRDNIQIEKVLAEIALQFSKEKEAIKLLSKKIS